MEVLQMPSISDAIELARASDVRVVDYLIANNPILLSKEAAWDKPQNKSEAKKHSNINLCASEKGDLLTELTKSICDSIKFPKSTAFLHGLGCVASACSKSFKFNYHGQDLPLNMYVVTAQPPSTGKSGVHSYFYRPIEKAYSELNEINTELQLKLKKQIAKLSKELDSCELIGGEFSSKDQYKFKELAEMEKELLETPIWRPTLTDATIEAAEIVCGKQTGMFVVSSAESDAINNLLGLTYGDGKAKKTNHGLVLNGWDGEYFSSSRVTRDSYCGYVRGSIAVIAQDQSVDSLLGIAEQGRGTAERFLLLREPSLLGTRTYGEYIPVDKDLLSNYTSLIKHIVEEEDVTIKIPSNIDLIIRNYRQGIESGLLDGGVYGNNLMTGFMGKADKHILKIACTLFVIDKWQKKATREYTLTDDYIFWAISLFSELAKFYQNSASELGFAGDDAEIEKMIDLFGKYAERGKLKVSINSFRSNHHKTKPFNLVRSFKKTLTEKLLPALSEMNYCVFSDTHIYINPRLK